MGCLPASDSWSRGRNTLAAFDGYVSARYYRRVQLLEMFGACYCYVLVRAFQQRNVAFANYLWVFPTSMVMACFDVFLVAFIAHSGWSLPIVAANGCGGALGCLSAIYLHRKYVKNREKP